jgi:hypothetical protein
MRLAQGRPCARVSSRRTRFYRGVRSAKRTPAAVTALVAAFDGRGTVEPRARIAEALSRASTDHDRVRAALVRMLEDDPLNAARHLVDRGEWSAVPDLVRAVEPLARSPVADCEICAGEHLRALAFAVRVLGGALSESQKARSTRCWASFVAAHGACCCAQRFRCSCRVEAGHATEPCAAGGSCGESTRGQRAC